MSRPGAPGHTAVHPGIPDRSSSNDLKVAPPPPPPRRAPSSTPAQRRRPLQVFEAWLHRRRRDVGCAHPRCPSLTITGWPGAGGRAVGPDIVRYLDLVHDCEGGGWLLVDDAFVAAAETWSPGKPPSQCPGPGSGGGSGGGSSSPAELVRAVAGLGHCVLTCEGAAWWTRPLDNVFHAFLTGSESARVNRPGGEPERSAWTQERLRERDLELRQRCTERYGASYGDPCDYHLVVNSDHFNEELAVRTIADSLLEWGAARAPKPGRPGDLDVVKIWSDMPKICKAFPGAEA